MFSTRSRRRLAAYMLCVWVFALTSSVVNACVLGVQLRHVASTDVQATHGMQPSGHHAVAAGNTLLEGLSPEANAPACTKFCDDESAPALIVKPPVEPSGKVWLFSSHGPSMADAALALPSGVRNAQQGLLRGRVPIPIAYLRLTL